MRIISEKTKPECFFCKCNPCQGNCYEIIEKPIMELINILTNWFNEFVETSIVPIANILCEAIEDVNGNS